jgi:glycosyltransferase involved in cell wall biosynthesis
MGIVRPENEHPIEKLNVPLFALLRGQIHGCSLLIPKTAFEALGVFDESRPTTQDYALWFQFMRQVPVHFDARVLLRSRVHPQQGSNSHAGHLDECNELWTGFLRALTDAEMTAMEGSRYRFLRRTADFLSRTPYKKALAVAEAMTSDCLAETKVTVIIPFHERVPLTMNAAKSALAQSHRNIEVILVDDGSLDDTSALQKLAALDPRLKILRQARGGPAMARNRGVGEARGEYVAFLDSDDSFVEEKVAVQLRFMMDNDLSFSHTSYVRQNERGESFETIDSGRFCGRVFPQIISGCPIATPTVMAATDLLKVNRFPEEMEYGEDVCLWIQLAYNWDVGGLPYPLTRVRVGPGTAAFDKSKQLIGLVNILSFVVGRPALRAYTDNIRQLLSELLKTLESSEYPSDSLANAASSQTERRRVGRLSFTDALKATRESLRQDGTFVTVRRIARRVRLALDSRPWALRQPRSKP